MSLSAFKDHYHKTSYEAINPTQPKLSQTGRTVLVTGGNSGIGFAIARSFAVANATRVIIIGRRPDVVQSAAVKLQQEMTKLGSPGEIQGRVCDIANLDSTAALWDALRSEDITVDVLVLSAAAYGAEETILKGGRNKVWSNFESNVRSTLDFADRFNNQPDSEGRQKALVHVSSSASYMWSTMAPERPSYGLTKNASTLLLQQIAKDTKVSDMQVVSFHPGGILTESSARNLPLIEKYGWTLDDENLPGDFAVWAASAEAAFLHGRFVWANWDVDQLSKGSIRQLIDEDEHFLKIGLEGLSEKMGGMQL